MNNRVNMSTMLIMALAFVPGSVGLKAQTGTRTTRSAPTRGVAPRPQGAPFPNELTVLDRNGRVVWKLAKPGDYRHPALSPDNRRLAVTRIDPAAPTESHIWVFELNGDGARQVTAGPGSEQQPIWSDDGKQIVYSSLREPYGLYTKAADGTGNEALVYRPPFLGVINLSDWSRDRRFMSYWTGGVVYVAPLANQSVTPTSGQYQTVEFVREESAGNESSFSPDGRFLTYFWNGQVYVQGFDDSSGKPSTPERWRVSSHGAEGVVYWRKDARELYYLATDGWMMAVEVASRSPFRTGTSRRLFRAPTTLPLAQFLPIRIFGSASRDGQRFAFAAPVRPPREEVALTPPLLSEYVGSYALDNGDRLEVTLDDRQLILEDDRGVKRRLLAQSPSAFFFSATNGEVEFVRDERGTVTHLMWLSWDSGRLFGLAGAPSVAKATRR